MAVPITITGLTKRFGPTVAVDGVELRIEAGELFFLLGPSGCGKTTLLRMIAGFTEPTAGSMRFADRDVTHLPANKRHCGMVFQSYALWPHMTVAQNVAFGLDVRKVGAEERKKRVERALAAVRMEKFTDRKPNQLSGGQQQRVALARALVIEPIVLLLDEPLSNLDAKLRLEMRSEIKRICKAANITGVYVTHDQKEALSMADRMAVLDHGKVVQVGPPRDLYDRPVNRFVADFLGESNFIPARFVAREHDQALLQTPAGTLRSSVFPPQLAQGRDVTCLVRPEAVRLLNGDTGGGTLNQFDARRGEPIYLGEVAQHQLVIAGGVALKAFELNPRPGAAEGDRVRIGFDPGDVVVLQD